MWRFIIRAIALCPPLLRLVNRLIINRYASSTPSRPHPYSLWSPSRPRDPAPHRIARPELKASITPPPDTVSDYTSWPSLFDRGFTGRHLPPRPPNDGRPIPKIDDVMALLDRPQAGMVESCRSSALFCFFAQWFTDSFLRKDPLDPRRTTSNHEIDLCQIYGLDEPSTWALRTGQGGRLKTRDVRGESFPPLLFDEAGQLKREFFTDDPVNQWGLTYLRGGRAPYWEGAISMQFPTVLTDPGRRNWFYAAGLDRGGSTIFYSAFNTIFLREHNRLADLIASQYAWDDDRVFETARMVNMRQLLTIVINDYIAHLGGLFPFALDPGFAEGRRWYRTNRISIEFDLLYRWHSLVPDTLQISGKSLPQEDFRYNNQALEDLGLAAAISAASTQRAGRIGLHNTPAFLMPAERAGLAWARDYRVESFNSYRKRFGLQPYRSLQDLTGDETTAAELRSLYGDAVDAVEYTVGLLAEKRSADQLLPETLQTIVAYDAFTHILTNPLLATEINCEATFSKEGLASIKATTTLDQLVRRNVPGVKQVSLKV